MNKTESLICLSVSFPNHWGLDSLFWWMWNCESLWLIGQLRLEAIQKLHPWAVGQGIFNFPRILNFECRITIVMWNKNDEEFKSLNQMTQLKCKPIRHIRTIAKHKKLKLRQQFTLSLIFGTKMQLYSSSLGNCTVHSFS